MAETNNLPFIYYITDEQGQHLSVSVFTEVPWGSQHGQPEPTNDERSRFLSNYILLEEETNGLRVQ